MSKTRAIFSRFIEFRAKIFPFVRMTGKLFHNRFGPTVDDLSYPFHDGPEYSKLCQFVFKISPFPIGVKIRMETYQNQWVRKIPPRPPLPKGGAEVGFPPPFLKGVRGILVNQARYFNAYAPILPFNKRGLGEIT
ncbi:hypothetical protein Desti_3840 [Desulfomonile tiedjei DSM 6799]|uniref:Uncharacterized protein n=1 Tax=Desulfomonile tiedjei (strain ATCC 49306 / DSM 6799 / DCB-1) TaxID=706587 RepID=I4CA91_DESTA|nr:hypothetical protein Desti_3840 [Desulfomonile tiedjei DSM 6799]